VELLRDRLSCLVRFRVLGALELVEGTGAAVPMRSPGMRRLLAALLVHAGAVVPVDRLTDVLWGDDQPANPDNALQTLVSRLRRVLGDAELLLTRAPGYLLCAAADDIDAGAFAALVDQARTAAPHDAVTLLDSALALWRGPAYAEFADDEFARAEAARLNELRTIAAEVRVDAGLALGRPAEAAARAEALVAAHPLRERPHAQLMLALHRAGRQPDALGVYRRYRQHLNDELGLTPSAALQRLEGEILRQDPGLHPAEPAQPGPQPAGPPRPAVALIGRERDAGELANALEGSRVVTLTGVGGIGKTALALSVAPGAPVCELAAVTRADDVAPAVAHALGFPSLDAAVIGLAGTRRLLVLDNCEHVLDAAAAAVERLSGCPGVSVLSTSREPLDVAGERVLPLRPLALPDSDDVERLRDSPAVALLLARARDAGVEIELDADTAATVVALCTRLDGLPLAIELAAARTRSLAPAEILAHLEHRLDLLARPRRRGPPRHRSIDAAIAWSHERLPEPARRLFDRLGVFAGRFTAETARAVAGEPGEDLLGLVDRLDQLVAQSLLTVRSEQGRSWYGLLDTLRTFARTQLAERGELVTLQDRWVDALEAVARDVHRDMNRRNSPATWSALHTAQADLRAAVRHCLSRDDGPERVAVLLRPLTMTVHSGPAKPIAELADAALARWPDPARPGWAAVATVGAFAQLALHDLDRATRLAERALAAPRDDFAAVVARRTLLVCELTAGRPQQALRWADEAIAEAAAAQQPIMVDEVGPLRAVVLSALGRTDEAIAQARSSHDAAVAHGSTTLQSWAALIHGCLLALREPDAANSTLTALAQRCREIGYPLGEAASCRAVGAIELVSGRPGAAATWLGRALEAFLRIGNAPHLQVTLRWIAALVRNEPGRAAARLLATAGIVRTPTAEILERAWLDPLLADTGDVGSALPLGEAVVLARSQLARVAAAPAPSPATAVPVPDRFALAGAVWTVSFAGRTVQLPDSKGLRDLATLLARPGREVHSVELLAAAVEQADTGEVLDARARGSYEARIVELQGELAEAEERGDRGRADAASLELDLLVEQLAAARGLGGRARRSGGTAERARTAVTWRIRSAIKRIDQVHPDLGRHLRGAVRTGLWCSYQPERPVAWELTSVEAASTA
jgi:predicted ATPase/DNA-binding SARP family transcriptional activator